MPGQQPACPVCARAERFRKGQLRPNEHVRIPAHIPRNDDRLPYVRVGLRNERVSFGETPGRALPVHANTLLLSVERMLLNPGNVVGDVVNQPDTERFLRHPKRACKRLTGKL
jgi:hypothetical protein